MDNEFNLTRNTMIEGAEDFALWLTKEHNLPIKGINKNLRKWKEQLE